MTDAAIPVGAQTEERGIHRVPDPFPLTWAGMIAMLGPQAINFGISVGGGEAYLLPNIAARGAFHMHWLMLVSVVLEAALVYECIKYSMCTGRSFFAGTNVLRPYGFWPWFWMAAAILTYAWPSWMAGAVVAAQRFTGISTQSFFPGLNPAVVPPQYIWAVVALVAVLAIFYFSDRTYYCSVRCDAFVTSWPFGRSNLHVTRRPDPAGGDSEFPFRVEQEFSTPVWPT